MHLSHTSSRSPFWLRYSRIYRPPLVDLAVSNSVMGLVPFDPVLAMCFWIHTCWTSHWRMLGNSGDAYAMEGATSIGKHLVHTLCTVWGLRSRNLKECHTVAEEWLFLPRLRLFHGFFFLFCSIFCRFLSQSIFFFLFPLFFTFLCFLFLFYFFSSFFFCFSFTYFFSLFAPF